METNIDIDGRPVSFSGYTRGNTAAVAAHVDDVAVVIALTNRPLTTLSVETITDPEKYLRRSASPRSPR